MAFLFSDKKTFKILYGIVYNININICGGASVHEEENQAVDS